MAQTEYCEVHTEYREAQKEYCKVQTDYYEAHTEQSLLCNLLLTLADSRLNDLAIC